MAEKKKALQILREYQNYVAFSFKPANIEHVIFLSHVWIGCLTLAAIAMYGAILGSQLLDLILVSVTFSVLGTTLLYFATWLCIFVYIDATIYKATREIEKYLPDFLQLASANASAGMPIDRAMWFAVRPHFGALKDEIEEIAKRVAAGESLKKALDRFGEKYDSQVLQESLSLITVGMESGGQLAGLLDKISTNIQETNLMKKEIGANVTTYVIFISVATILAAPLLYALSAELLGFIQQVTSELNFDTSGSQQGGMTLNVDPDSIDINEFRNFSFIMLTLSSISSAAIISAIKKGTVKESVKTIPIFIAVSFIIYFVTRTALSSVLATF